MASHPPVVYLLHGENEYGIAQFVANLAARLGDAALVDLNLTRLDGRVCSLEEVFAAAGALPFLAPRRLVVFTNPLARLAQAEAREKFLAYLDKIQPSTALVLIEYRTLTDEKSRQKGQLHWLERWALQSGERVFVRNYNQPKGPALEQWIRSRAQESGGRFTAQAAKRLASLVGEDTRQAAQEIEKLLVYVNDQRPVEVDDVEHLIAGSEEGNIFAMVDALGNRDGQLAMIMLQRLLAIQEPLSIFGMVVRQFRFLLLAREVLDHGGDQGEVVRQLKVHPYVGQKVTTQARRFTLADLETIYRRLLETDVAIKTGQMEGSLALQTLVAALTS